MRYAGKDLDPKRAATPDADQIVVVHMQEVVTTSRRFTVAELAALLLCKPTVAAVYATLDDGERFGELLDTMTLTPGEVQYEDREWTWD